MAEHRVPLSWAFRVMSIAWWVSGVGLVIAARLLGWVDERDVAELIASARDRSWATLPMAIVAFAIGSAMLVPLTLMMTACGVLLGPIGGFVHAALGSLAAAAFFHWIGHALGHPWVAHHAGPRITRITGAVLARGVPAVIALRLLPMAPHVVIAIAAGAVRLSFRDFMVGSAVVSLPLALALTILGGTFMDAGVGARTWLTVGLAALAMVATSAWLLRGIVRRANIER